MNIRRFFGKNSHETLTMIPKELGVELPNVMGKTDHISQFIRG